jgi:hypothetical protein
MKKGRLRIWKGCIFLVKTLSRKDEKGKIKDLEGVFFFLAKTLSRKDEKGKIKELKGLFFFSQRR